MKKLTPFLLSFLLMGGIFAQRNFNDSIALARNKLTKNAMTTLGAWAIVNIGTGFAFASGTAGETKYAWRMNAYWNIFNLGLAGLGYGGLRGAMQKKYSFSDNYKAQQAIEKLYVFNSGLDLAYIAGGFYLREKGKNQSTIAKDDQLKGYGTSIIIQGGFLLLMDAAMFTLHHRNTRRMNNKLQQFDLQMGPGGLGMAYHF